MLHNSFNFDKKLAKCYVYVSLLAANFLYIYSKCVACHACHKQTILGHPFFLKPSLTVISTLNRETPGQNIRMKTIRKILE